VHYRLTTYEANAINRRRTNGESIKNRMDESPPAWPTGAQAHIGNTVVAGDTVSMTVVRVWHDVGKYQRGISVLNGQCLLDGNDQYWVTSVHEGEGPGTWSWPPKV
jgi:hypothetical protein